MWYRSGVALLLGLSLGCGDEGSQPPAAADVETPLIMTPEVEPDAAERANGTAFELQIDGWTDSIDAKAQLNVVEGLRSVRLEITGGGQRDVLLLNVRFEDLEGSMGPHELVVGLPGGELDSAVARLDGQDYHSQTGQIEVSLSADGSITGSFELDLAEDPEVRVGEELVFELSDDVRRLKGQFGGQWKLFCQSHMPGHMSALMRGGDYCDALKF